MSSPRPTPLPPTRAGSPRPGTPNARTTFVLKIVVTILSAIVLVFLANGLRSESNDSATSLSTQSLLSLPSNQQPASTAIPTTAPLQLPTTTPEATATVVPTPQPTATAAPAPTPVPAVPTPAQAAHSVTTEAPAPAAPPQVAQPDVAQPEPAQPQADQSNGDQSAGDQSGADQSDQTSAAAPAQPEAPTVEVATPEPAARPQGVGTEPIVVGSEPIVVVETDTPEPTATPEPTPTPTPEPVNIYDMELYVLGSINQIRANAGLAPLVLDESISVISRDWSTQMGSRNFFEHRPGSELDIMMPAGWLRWGENIASAPDIEYAQDSLVASPGHFENMVGDYTHVGIGVYSTGRQVWVTQNFGKY